MSVNHYDDICDLPKYSLRKLRSFFEDHKKLENKYVLVEEFQGKDAAWEVVRQPITDYDEDFKKKDYSKSSPLTAVSKE